MSYMLLELSTRVLTQFKSFALGSWTVVLFHNLLDACVSVVLMKSKLCYFCCYHQPSPPAGLSVYLNESTVTLILSLRSIRWHWFWKFWFPETHIWDKSTLQLPWPRVHWVSFSQHNFHKHWGPCGSPACVCDWEREREREEMCTWTSDSCPNQVVFLMASSNHKTRSNKKNDYCLCFTLHWVSFETSIYEMP